MKPTLKLRFVLLPVALLLCSTLLSAARLDAQPAPDAASEPEKEGDEAEGDAQASSVGKEGQDKKLSAEEELGLDPCAVPKGPREAWVDRMQKGVFWTVCSTSLWFDSFYGDADDYLDYRSTYGRLGIAVEYDEQDGSPNLDTRFKARYPLPKLERRIDAFVGRFDEDEFVEGRNEDISSLPPLFTDTDAEWLLGLGYSPARDAKTRFDIDGGVRLDFPMDPFVRGRWRTHRPLGEKRLLRFSQTAFWRRSLGTGTTSQLDVERSLGPTLLTRWRTVGTVAERIDGLEWRTSLTLYHLLRDDTALAYQIEGKGETDDEIPVFDWLAGVVYRQRIWRDWFFLELRAQVHWPKQEVDEPREAEAGVAIGFEILFGDHPSLTRRHPSWDKLDEAVSKAAHEAADRAHREKSEPHEASEQPSQENDEPNG